MRAAVLSSATRQPAEILKGVFVADSSKQGRSEMISQLIATAAGEGSADSLGKVMATIAPADNQHLEVWQLSALGSLLDALERKNLALTAVAQNADILQRINLLFDWAGTLAAESKTKDSTREAAIRLLGRRPERQQ